MALSKKEQALLEQLQQKAEEPAGPDEEVEWWEEDTDGNRRGGRMPYSRAWRMFHKWAPDVFPSLDPDAEEDEGGKGEDKPQAGGGATRLFQGKRQAG